MTILRRLKNLWKLSEYRMKETAKEQVLVRDVQPVKKLATIILDKPDYFEPEHD